MRFQFNIMLTVALAVLLGTVGARVFKRLKIPQVVAYILIGVLLGATGLNVIDSNTVEGLAPLSLLALGIIGFMIGGELKLDVFRRHGRRAMIILVAEGFGAFAVVTLLVGLVTGDWPLAILLGAISSATAPAATVDVLWEYRTLGVLTTMIVAIVALDDGLALLLYGFASAIARTALDHTRFSVMTVARPLYEIVGALGLGGAVALAFRWVSVRTREKELILAFALGSILLLVGISQAINVDMILAAMAFGSLYANLAKKQGDEVFGIVQRFAPPIFVLFFVLVGARLRIGAMNGLIWLIALLYVVGRTGGKFAGVWLGSRLASAPEAIKRYLGFCLFSQAGVAIGLAVLSSQVFSTHPEVSATIVAVVTATTFFVQVIGPSSVKYAVTKAGEVGRNVTEEDLLATLAVKDVMRANQPALRLHAPLAEVMDTVARSEAVYFPVVDSDDLFRGVVTLEGMKAVLNMPDVGPFIVAEDLMEQVQYTIKPDASLRDARQLMKDRARDFLVVTEPNDDRRLAGLITQRSIDRALEVEIARRRGHSDVPAVA